MPKQTKKQQATEPETSESSLGPHETIEGDQAQEPELDRSYWSKPLPSGAPQYMFNAPEVGEGPRHICSSFNEWVAGDVPHWPLAKLPSEGLYVLSHALGMAQRKPWALPGVSAKSRDGRLWKSSNEGGRVVLFAHVASAQTDAEARRRRDLEETVQPLATRKDTLEGLLKHDLTDHYRQAYQAEYDRVSVELAEKMKEISTLKPLQVDPVTGKRAGAVERWEFSIEDF